MCTCRCVRLHACGCVDDSIVDNRGHNIEFICVLTIKFEIVLAIVKTISNLIVNTHMNSM